MKLPSGPSHHTAHPRPNVPVSKRFPGSEESRPSNNPAADAISTVDHQHSARATRDRAPPIVRFIARRIHERLPQHVPIEDLYSAGMVGLVDALAKFDSSKQVQFRSYAQFRIRGAILDSPRTLDWSPRERRRKGRAVSGQSRLLRRNSSVPRAILKLLINCISISQLINNCSGN
jgi:DNA-directed RNA polymerase specialized sigma subunit